MALLSLSQYRTGLGFVITEKNWSRSNRLHSSSRKNQAIKRTSLSSPSKQEFIPGLPLFADTNLFSSSHCLPLPTSSHGQSPSLNSCCLEVKRRMTDRAPKRPLTAGNGTTGRGRLAVAQLAVAD